MADRKISDLTALTTPAAGDYLPIVDISEAAAASRHSAHQLLDGDAFVLAGSRCFADVNNRQEVT